MLGARLVYVALNDPKGGPLAGIAQTGHYASDDRVAADLGPVLLDWARNNDPHDLYMPPATGTACGLRITCRQIGHNAELGVIAAGFDGDGPAPLHHLLLDVSATQATTGLNNALLVDSLRHSEARLQDQTIALEALNRTAATTAIEKDLNRVVQTVTDAGVELSGAEFGAFFYNVVEPSGESYMLYALSGAPAEAFAAFPMPRNTKVFAPTFSGEGVIRSDDIKRDPRYGQNAPHSGMPQGHLPVRSYLAAPVTSRTGEVLGGLFFGHSSPGRFTEEHERRMVGLAAQAAIAIDNARLFQAVQSANETLEERVAERTRELDDAHEALKQSQKMEAVGQLTGGLAHDFNNLLGAISGALDLMDHRIRQGRFSELDKYLTLAQGASKRAAALTHRLLAFSRRQSLDPKPADLRLIVGGMVEMIQRAIGPGIHIDIKADADLWTTLVDISQVENALLNLCINARDAMPDGGLLTISTDNVALDKSAARRLDLPAGDYVSLSVADSGTGMSPEVVARAFDPFFTTKPMGEGTGLGLSMIYGFAQQSEGQVKITSELGRGTSVRIVLPRYRGQAACDDDTATPATDDADAPDRLVLVVDDEPALRVILTDMLTTLGYRTIEAEDAASAMVVLASSEPVDLLLTDVGLPNGMNGRQLADAARVLRPSLNILFATGYAETALIRQGQLEPGMAVLTKPFSLDALAAKVRDFTTSG